VADIEIRTDRLSPTIAVSFLVEGKLHRAKCTLDGRHNLQNIKTAVAVGRYFKVPGTEIVAALEGYTPSNPRSQWLTHRGVDFYWDAYNANPSSMTAALNSFAALSPPNDSVVILGEMRELGAESAAAHRRVVLKAGQTARTLLLVGNELREVAREFDRPHFADSRQLTDWFWSQDWSGKRVFVKGSRGNKLEVLLE
jgi:UDP-N-acetylmuramoyl-tripeptide--D-alanyl-D-alanine ligase